MVRYLHNAVCWLLSAVLLLTNGWPVAIKHAHDVGGNPYHHSHRINGIADASALAPAVAEADGAVSGVTEHVHMLWLGWEVTILPPKGSRSGPCPSAAAVGMLAQPVEKDSTESTGVATPRATTCGTPFADIVLPADAALPSGGSAWRVASLPLCETARHLRSGVQLI